MKIEDFFQENQQNIANLLEEDKLKEIYTKVTQKYSVDQQSRVEKIRKLQDYIKLALLITQEKNYPFEGAANAMLPLTANAVINFGATAYPPLVQDDEIVKFKTIGNDDGKVWIGENGQPVMDEATGQPKMQFVGAKADRGRRMSTMMNYQVNEEMPWYKKDLFQYLMVLAAVGTLYKKVFYDPINKRCVSKFMMPDKLIINDSVCSLDDAVITEVLDLSPTQVMENIRNGVFVDYEFDWEKESSQATMEESINPEKDKNNLPADEHRFLNQYTYLDLDEDGFPEPYIVTIDLAATEVVRIIPDFYIENVEYTDDKISKIKRNKTFVDFIFIPSADGGHLGMGFGHLLYNSNNIANGTINQMLDAGHLSIKGSGFIGKSMNIRGGRFSMGLGEWKMVDNFGGNIRDSIVPLPTPEISPALFSLLGLLIDSAKETGSLRDVLTGDTAANMAPTTYMGLVEQGLKQFLAIFKNFHNSMKQEFRLIRECNAKYLSDEDYARVLDLPDKDVSAEADFSAKDCDVVPVADPASVTSSQKMAQAQILQALMQDPFYDPIKIRKMWNNAVQIPGLDDALVTPQPQPDANMVLAQAEDKKANAKLLDVQLRAKELDEEGIERRFDIEDTVADIKVKESQVIKNIADAQVKEKEHNLKTLTTVSEAMTRRIEAQANAETAQIEEKKEQPQEPVEIEEAQAETI